MEARARLSGRLVPGSNAETLPNFQEMLSAWGFSDNGRTISMTESASMERFVGYF